MRVFLKGLGLSILVASALVTLGLAEHVTSNQSVVFLDAERLILYFSTFIICLLIFPFLFKNDSWSNSMGVKIIVFVSVFVLLVCLGVIRIFSNR